jgi:hypothetical protein
VGGCKGLSENQPCQTSPIKDVLDGTCQYVGGGDLMRRLVCVPKGEVTGTAWTGLNP